MLQYLKYFGVLWCGNDVANTIRHKAPATSSNPYTCSTDEMETAKHGKCRDDDHNNSGVYVSQHRHASLGKWIFEFFLFFFFLFLCFWAAVSFHPPSTIWLPTQFYRVCLLPACLLQQVLSKPFTPVEFPEKESAPTITSMHIPICTPSPLLQSTKQVGCLLLLPPLQLFIVRQRMS